MALSLHIPGFREFSSLWGMAGVYSVERVIIRWGKALASVLTNLITLIPYALIVAGVLGVLNVIPPQVEVEIPMEDTYWILSPWPSRNPLGSETLIVLGVIWAAFRKVDEYIRQATKRLQLIIDILTRIAKGLSGSSASAEMGGGTKNIEADDEGMPLFTTQNKVASVASDEKSQLSEEEAREAYFAELDKRIRERWGR